MTLYVLDTDMLTLLEEGHPAVGRRFLQERLEDTAITVLSVEEQLSGWYTEVRKAKRTQSHIQGGPVNRLIKAVAAREYVFTATG